ncbi:hypothetical protein K525DRAFT_214668 [Schizophyllum commune Loenen D]|nr:hypothetical protein K525DRAFT_214668 [Schizophyllum commune Loenen D]
MPPEYDVFAEGDLCNAMYDNWTDDEDNDDRDSDDDDVYYIPEIPLLDEIYVAKPWPAKEYAFPPPVEDVQRALDELRVLLQPPRKPRKAYCEPDLEAHTKTALVQVKYFLQCYIERAAKAPGDRGIWTAASLSVARADSKGSSGTYLAKQIRARARRYISYREIPHFSSPPGQTSCMDDEDITQRISQDIVDFCSTPEMMELLNRDKPISLDMALDWLKRHDYRFALQPCGMYADGHEDPAQVTYRVKVYGPAIEALLPRMRKWDSKTGQLTDPVLKPGEKIAVLWKLRWVHKDTKPKPWVKGEGLSLMVADFVSMDSGWLKSPDGTDDARVLLHAGKNRDGYFDSNGVLRQFHRAVDLVKEHYPDEEHIWIYDNAPTHVKRPEASLSARKMPKGPSGKFFVQTTKLDAEGRPMYGTDGKLAKEKVVKMQDTEWDGKVQKLYFDEKPGAGASDDEKEHAGKFKGMRRLLEERALWRDGMKAQCKKKFTDCPDDGKTGKLNCCCRRTLFNQPDFVNIPTILETTAQGRGATVIFLPKFHCELNPIEMSWSYSKRVYRDFPFSKRQDVLEKNVIRCLEVVPLITQRRSVINSLATCRC